MITKESFCEKYHISDELFQSAGMSWEDLCEIYQDFSLKKRERYEDILEEFYTIYLKDVLKGKKKTEPEVKIHSIRSRVKNPEHLIAKIIRKKQKNQKKYRNLDKTNYEKFITDLIGIRCLVLFKADWRNFHQYLVSAFENDVKYYIRDCISDFDEDINHSYIAEKPKVHIRNGDSRDLYDSVLSPDSILDGKIYRSVHYIIKYKGVYLEIQVRTLFEEGWGEIDHAVVYPYYQDDKILKEYTELLNRLSGLADEMSSFFYRLKNLEVQVLTGKEIGQKDEREFEAETKKIGSIKQAVEPERMAELENTPYDCLQSVLDE